MKFENGSTGVINYFSNGSKAYSKERIEIYSQNKTIIIDNFRKSEYFGFKSSGIKRSQDKGHFDQFRLFVEHLKNGGSSIIPYTQIMNTSYVAIAAIESLKTYKWVNIP